MARLPLYVCSSGSLKAQELFFRYNEAGDLRSLFAGHFDTGVGAKIDAASYARLAQAIRAPAQEILFLSDDIRELAAARDAGFQVAQVVKEQNRPDASSQILMDFDASELAPQTSVGPGPK